MNQVDELSPLERAVSDILASDLFAASPSHSRLLRYLVERTQKNEVPKEIEIAIDVFDRRNAAENPDSSFVRVHVHKLRKRLLKYYSTPGNEPLPRVAIPKGGYRVVLEQDSINVEGSTDTGSQSAWQVYLRSPAVLIGCAVVLMVSLLTNAWLLLDKPQDIVAASARSPLWSAVIPAGKTPLIVIGDFYVFRQLDSFTGHDIFVRDPKINSDSDLRELIEDQEVTAGTVVPSRNRFVPPSGIYGLLDLVRDLKASGLGYEVVTSSDLSPNEMRGRSIIYIGLLKSLGPLRSSFDASVFECDEHCRRLYEPGTRDKLRTRGSPGETHTDYGYVSALRRGDGSTVVLLSGFTDTGIRHAVRTVTNADSLVRIDSALREQSLDFSDNFEILMKVEGFDYEDISGAITYAGPLDVSEN